MAEARQEDELPSESTIGGMSTQERQKYEVKNFQKKQQTVANAHHILANPPKKKTNQWVAKAEKARHVISSAKQTKCIFFAADYCMHGSSCPFLHKNCEDSPSDETGEEGVVFRWRPYAQNGPYTLVRLSSNREMIFAHPRTFNARTNQIREGMKVRVFELEEPRKKSQSRVAGRVEIL